MDGYNYGPYDHRGQHPASGSPPPPHDPRYPGYPTYPSYQHSSSFTGVVPSDPQLYPSNIDHPQYPPPSAHPPPPQPPPYNQPPYGYSPYPAYPSYSPQPSFNRQESYPSPYAPPPPYSNPPVHHLEGMLSNVTLSDPIAPPATTTPPLPLPPHTGQTGISESYNYQNYSGSGSGSFNSSSYHHSYSVGGGGVQSSSSLSHSQSLNNSGRVLLLHGNLDVWILSASNLPNMDMFSMSFQGILGGKKSSMTSDSYVTFSVANAVLGRTSVISNSVNPSWKQHFYVPVAHQASHIKFMVKDSDFVGAQLMGTVDIPTGILYSGDKVEGTYDILGVNGKPCKAGATLKLLIQYISIDKLKDYYQGVESGPNYIGVPGTYFPLRKGGNVTLYQDAHVPDGVLPEVTMEHGTPHVHGKCWVDVTDAISNARKFIYITGWSVYHNVQLLRDVPGSVYSLGDLLKSKAREGVRVLLLIWDDPTSTSIIGIKKEGLMQTHDEDTRRFFKNSSVHVILCPRSSGKRHGLIKQKEAGLIYTHHQKTVIFDSDAGNNMRKVAAFVGGLDLCDGRYDNPNHPIFRTLKTLHKEDFHNPTFAVPSAGSPREPWHDLHTRIDGPAAYDVLQNFEERWRRASKKTSQDTLLQMERIRDILKIDESPYLNDNNPDTWHVQIFRSIDSNSVKGFPKDSREASSKNLVCGKNILVDMSIHTAYVKAIRSAQRFIYIENQYFLGSSFNWRSHTDLGANNLIPMEIALKIASKIKSNERFSVYIVIPMWPEGNPTETALQRILLWQNKTMQMMYETIYSALREVGLDNTYTPQDYLNFFCLGNREAPDSNGRPSATPTTPNAPSVRAEKSRRFMIYVHSKGMIVDDEYLIVGSANINQRSLEGSRDTEIAMGAYQPRHTWNEKRCAPHGQIHAYRMSLWAEHTGVVEECFNNPESLECMQRVRAMGEFNWNLFYRDEITEMTGHLIKYPVDVERTGVVKPLQGCSTFPDVGGNICGSSGILDISENLTI